MSIIFLTLLFSHLFIASLNGEEETTENPLTDTYLLDYSELTTNSPLEGEEEVYFEIKIFFIISIFRLKLDLVVLNG